jgi:hypothetical protein
MSWTEIYKLGGLAESFAASAAEKKPVDAFDYLFGRKSKAAGPEYDPILLLSRSWQEIGEGGILFR